MLTPKAAVRSVLEQYAGFSGRAPRSEYWWWGMCVWIAVIVLTVPIMATAANSSYSGGLVSVISSLLLFVLLAGLIVPNLAVTVRRLHDANFSGWMVLLGLVPGVGGLILLVFMVLPSNSAGAQFDKVVEKNAAPAWNSQRLS